jgi:hypothetical protein
MFECLFERSADAIWHYDPETGVLLDCNEPAVQRIVAENKCQLPQTRPGELSPKFQPDGERSDVSTLLNLKKAVLLRPAAFWSQT